MIRLVLWSTAAVAVFALGWIAGATAWVCAAMAHEQAQGRP